MTDALKLLADRIQMGAPAAVARIAFAELTLNVEAGDILSTLAFLRDDPECEFKVLIDICGVDYPNRPRRFDVVYHLLSVARNQRVRVKVEAEENVPIPSVVS